MIWINVKHTVHLVLPFLLLFAIMQNENTRKWTLLTSEQVLHTNYSKISSLKLNQCPAVNLEQDLTIFPFSDRNSNMQVTPTKKKETWIFQNSCHHAYPWKCRMTASLVGETVIGRAREGVWERKKSLSI